MVRRVREIRGCITIVAMHTLLTIVVAGLLVAAASGSGRAADDAGPAAAALEAEFVATIRPLLAASCVGCHDARTHESGVRLDDVAAVPGDDAVPLWERIEKELLHGTMPPEDAAQPSAADRETLAAWVARGLVIARSRPVPRIGATRRLTVAQYRHTLQDLLGIDDDVTAGVPPDAVSRDGFTNQARTLQTSELHVEAFLAAAERALDAALVDPDVSPRIQRFRVDLGSGINPAPKAEPLVLGHISQLLPNADVLVTEPVPEKPFPFEPVAMRRWFRFIEGYQGNDTVRGWREFDGIEHAVFACLRGSDGDDVRRIVDPRGRNAEVVADGLLLRPSIPGARFLGDASKYGPLPNFKIAVRELPQHGRFRVTVRAARVDDGLLVGADAAAATERAAASVATEPDASGMRSCTVPAAGIYLVDVRLADGVARSLLPDGTPPPDVRELVLDVGGLHLAAPWYQSGFAVVRLPAGPVSVRATAGSAVVERVALVRLDEAEPLARRFTAFERRVPWLGVHLGLRRDCGSTLAAVGPPRPVVGTDLQDHVFESAIANFPDPDVEADNPNYLAGIREIAVRSEFTDGRDVPRLRVRSVEFEGPFLESWPPPSHRAIVDVPGSEAVDPEARARAILGRFATRAFRRPASPDEIDALVQVWRTAIAGGADDARALRDGLLATLAAPQCLFLVETSAGPEPEPLDGWELASKLSYFLWNSPPDEQLRARAADGTLADSLAAEVDRLVADPRFDRFAEVFVAEWLGLGRFDVVETDRTRFPRLTAHARPSLRAEPARLFAHLLRTNAPLSELVASDTVVVDEVAADYYGLGARVESGFDFVPVRHDRADLGGVLTLPAVLAGLSDGREPNPVKRGAWFARAIVGRPPPDPPPNVPKLDDLSQLPLRARLEQHRSAQGCTACHEGIDPWGLPFEAFAADGLQRGAAVDASSRLPDGTQVGDFAAFRDHVRSRLLDDVVAEFLRRLATYGCGRPPAVADVALLRSTAAEVRSRGGGLRDALQAVIASDLVLTK